MCDICEMFLSAIRAYPVMDEVQKKLLDIINSREEDIILHTLFDLIRKDHGISVSDERFLPVFKETVEKLSSCPEYRLRVCEYAEGWYD